MVINFNDICLKTLPTNEYTRIEGFVATPQELISLEGLMRPMGTTKT